MSDTKNARVEHENRRVNMDRANKEQVRLDAGDIAVFLEKLPGLLKTFEIPLKYEKGVTAILGILWLEMKGYPLDDFDDKRFMSEKEFAIIVLLDKYEHLDDDTAAEVIKMRTGATDGEIAAAMTKAGAVYEYIAESESGMLREEEQDD